MEFQFDVVWMPSLDRPDAVAEGLTAGPIAVFNRSTHEEPSILERIYRV